VYIGNNPDLSSLVFPKEALCGGDVWVFYDPKDYSGYSTSLISYKFAITTSLSIVRIHLSTFCDDKIDQPHQAQPRHLHSACISNLGMQFEPCSFNMSKA